MKDKRRVKNQRYSRTAGFVLVLIVIGILWQPLWELFQINLLLVQTSRALILDPSTLPVVMDKLEQHASDHCRLQWHVGIAAAHMGDIARQQEAWSRVLACSSKPALSLVRAAASQNLELARLAVQYHPDNSGSWLWLAGILSDKDPAEAIRMYSTGLKIEITNGAAWCQLAKLQEAAGDLASAEDAFAHCCNYGDTGSHGCWGAGRLAEARGDLTAAARYYLSSRWQVSRDKGKELDSLSH